MVTAQVAIVKSFYDGLMRNDVAFLESLLDSESLVVKEADSLPYGGEHLGLQGFRSLLQQLTGCWN